MFYTFEAVVFGSERLGFVGVVNALSGRHSGD